MQGKLETSQGTSNLDQSRKKCMQRRGVDENPMPGGPQPPPPAYTVGIGVKSEPDYP